MAHPLYPVARRLVGRHVYVHHISGRVYPGILQGVNQRGIYLYHTSPVSFNEGESQDFEILTNGSTGDEYTPVYGPAGYFGFGALAGLSLGAAAGAFLW